MSSLDDALSGVTPSESPTDSPVLEDAPESPAPAAVTQPSTDDGARQSGQSIDQLKAEFNRKFEAVLGRLEKLAAPAPQTPPPVVAPAPREFSIDELRQAMANPAATPAIRQQIQEEITQKLAVEAALRATESRARTERAQTLKQSATEQAVNTYKGLGDPNSAFYRETDRELQKRLQEIGDYPTIVLDAANAVAARQRASAEGRGHGTAGLAGGRTSAPVGGTAADGMSDEKYADIASRLSRALPKGKKFNKDQILSRSKEYRDNAQLFTNGGGR